MKRVFDNIRTPHIIQVEAEDPRDCPQPFGLVLLIPTPDGEQFATQLANHPAGVTANDFGTIHFFPHSDREGAWAELGFVPRERRLGEAVPIFRIAYNNKEQTDFTLLTPPSGFSWEPPATMATGYTLAKVQGLRGYDMERRTVYLLKNGCPIMWWEGVEEGKHEGFRKERLTDNCTMFITAAAKQGDPDIELMVTLSEDGSSLIF